MKIKFLKKIYTIDTLDLKKTYNKSHSNMINFWDEFEKSGSYYLFLKEIDNKYPIGFSNLGYRRGIHTSGPGPINQHFEGIYNMLYQMGSDNKYPELWICEDLDNGKKLLGAKVSDGGKNLRFIITASKGSCVKQYSKFFNSWNGFSQPKWLIDKLLEEEYYPDLTEALKNFESN